MSFRQSGLQSELVPSLGFMRPEGSDVRGRKEGNMGHELGFQDFQLEVVLQNKLSHKAEEGLLVLVCWFCWRSDLCLHAPRSRRLQG